MANVTLCDCTDGHTVAYWLVRTVVEAALSALNPEEIGAVEAQTGIPVAQMCELDKQRHLASECAITAAVDQIKAWRDDHARKPPA